MVTLVVDSSALCYAAAYSTGSLHYGDVYTGVIFGFLNQVLKLSNEFHTNKFIFCWDSRSSIRRKTYDWYKLRDNSTMTEDDKKYREIVHAQIPVLRRKIIPQLGFANSFHQPGYEADDIIASIVLNELADKPVMVSSDKDLYQLLHKAPQYRLKHGMYTKRELQRDFGIEPPAWADVKALAGCESDTVPGIPKVGDKTAAKYLRGHLTKGVVYQKIISQEGQDIRKRNAWLVSLPLPGTEVPVLERDSLDYDKFLDVCSEYGIRKLQRQGRWEDLFTRR